jgi:hypothetical protein
VFNTALDVEPSGRVLVLQRVHGTPT